MKLMKVHGVAGGGSQYEIKVSGDARTIKGITADGDNARDGRIWGAIGGGTDTYEFDGEIVSMDVPDDSWVTVDGRRVDMQTDNSNPDPEPPTDSEPEPEDSGSSYSPPTDTSDNGESETEQTDSAADDSGETETRNRPAQTTTIGGSAPDTLAWVVALGAVAAAIYMSQQ